MPESTLWGWAPGPWKRKQSLLRSSPSPPPKKNVEPVCPMDDVRLLVWSHWRAGRLDPPLPPVDQVASSKGSRYCWCCRRPAGPGSPVGADVVDADGPGSPSCCGLGRPRWLTRRYPPYPEKEQILLTTLIFSRRQNWLWAELSTFSWNDATLRHFPFFDQNLPFLLKMVSKCHRGAPTVNIDIQALELIFVQNSNAKFFKRWPILKHI